jgi:GTPase SAR1 family protein
MRVIAAGHARAIGAIPDRATEANMKTESRPVQEDLIGRKNELRRARAAIRNRKSFLIWGPADAGKTSLVKRAVAELPEKDRQGCIYWSGAASVRQLAEELLRAFYAAGDPCVRKKIREDGCVRETSIGPWFRGQSSGQLKSLLYLAAAKGRYSIFLDHLPPATQSMARFLKEIIWRCKTPVYLLARGCDRKEIGHAWSIYFANEYRIPVGPLPVALSRELLERSIRRFRLDRFDLAGFRDEILRLSAQLPGSVIKMCELAVHPRYHHGGQIKVNLVHVDYLMLADPLASLRDLPPECPTGRSS